METFLKGLKLRAVFPLKIKRRWRDMDIKEFGITEEEFEKFWNVWAGKWHHNEGEFDFFWHGYAKLSEETNIDIKFLKKIIKYFRDKGFAQHHPTVNCDYEIAGSGNFLNDRYIDMSFDEIKPLLFYTENDLLNQQNYKNDKFYYFHYCKKCGLHFIGNADRTICKKCSESED
jgi:hypothetical protein